MRKRDADRMLTLQADRDRAQAKLTRHLCFVKENPSCDHVGKWQGGKCPNPRCEHGSSFGPYLDVAELDDMPMGLLDMDAPVSVGRTRYRRETVCEYTGSKTPPTKRYFWVEC